jgi:serine/threonine protein kinase
VEQIGRYRIERLLARGGMAEVFVGKAEGPGGFSKSVVIKRILPELAEDPTFVDMFLSEARLAAQLSHPNVVQVFDFGQHEGHYFLAMEHVRGQTLRALLKYFLGQGMPMPAAIAARIACGVCEGLQYAHDLRDEDGTPLNIVHRDVAPDNIMVTSAGMPKLVDFGVAKAVSNTHRSVAGTVKGKYAYMAPELVRGQEADRQVDVYALGVTLFELVTGKRPFLADNELALVQKIAEGRPPRATEVRAEVPEPLSQIIALAMHPSKQERYSDARSLQRVLEAWLNVTGQRVESGELAGLVEKVTLTRHAAVSSSQEPSGPKIGAMGTPASSSKGQAPVLGLGGPSSELDVRAFQEPADLRSRSTTAQLGGFDVAVDESQLRKPKKAPVALVAGLGVVLLCAGVAVALVMRAPPPAPIVPPAPVAVVPPKPAEPAPPVVAPEPKPEPERVAEPEPVPEPAPPQKTASVKPAAAVRTSPGEDGYLTLRSEPWCDVYLGAEKLGTTPLIRTPVASGRQQLLLKNDKVGLTRKLAVNIEPGRELKQAFVVEVGSVQIDAPAGSDVLVDGVRAGTAPLAAPIELVEGKHEVRVGGVMKTVKVRAGKTEHLAL